MGLERITMNSMREWAKDQGFEIGQRGRLPKEVVANYLMNHPAEARKFLKSQGLVVGKRGRVSRTDILKAVSK